MTISIYKTSADLLLHRMKYTSGDFYVLIIFLCLCNIAFDFTICMYIYLYHNTDNTCDNTHTFCTISLPSPYPAEVLRANGDRTAARYNRNGRQGDALAVLPNVSWSIRREYKDQTKLFQRRIQIIIYLNLLIKSKMLYFYYKKNCETMSVKPWT